MRHPRARSGPSGAYIAAARVQVGRGARQRSARHRAPGSPGRRWTTSRPPRPRVEQRRRRRPPPPRDDDPAEPPRRGGGRGHRLIRPARPAAAGNRRDPRGHRDPTSAPRRVAADSTATTGTSLPGRPRRPTVWALRLLRPGVGAAAAAQRTERDATAPTRATTRSRRCATEGQARTSPARSAKAGRGPSGRPTSESWDYDV